MSRSWRSRPEVSSDGSHVLVSGGQGGSPDDPAGARHTGAPNRSVGHAARPRAGIAVALPGFGSRDKGAAVNPEIQECAPAVHDLAIARHLQWARDFALAGDHASAVDELIDVQALKSELRVGHAA
jgi:hypothetical protein